VARFEALLAAALGDIARARGMTEVAKASGIALEALYPSTPEQTASACGLLRGISDRIPNTGKMGDSQGLISILWF
jgi:hypothetical protein